VQHQLLVGFAQAKVDGRGSRRNTDGHALEATTKPRALRQGGTECADACDQIADVAEPRPGLPSAP